MRKRFRDDQQKSIGIRELARRSGVSPSTVSRVFNGYDDVSEETRKRVLEVARELDYTPSAAARALVRQRSQLIGIILETGPEHPDLQHPFFQEVLVALKNALGRASYDLLLFATEQPSTSPGQHAYARRVRHHGVDGVAVMGVDPRDRELDKLLETGTPTIGVDIDLVGPRAGFVTTDNAGGARMAVRHLYERGHRRIATISGQSNTKPGVDRLLGYRQELESLGIPYRPEYVAEGDFYTESGVAATEQLLDLPEPPTAIFAAADMMALGVLRVAKQRGLDIPGDFAVVGFDDIQVAALSSPPLTTIRQDKAGIGGAVAEALLRLIEQPDATPPVIVLPAELVVRGSA